MPPVIDNEVTRRLGIDFPIVQGGMQWVGTADLAAAVSNAGGLGTLTALTQPSPEALGAEIERCRDMTDRPFAVNLTILPSINPPPYEAYLEVIIRSGVRILETAGYSPKALMPRLKSAAMVVIHKCTSVRHALAAERAGVDIISMDGFECAGHPGEDDVSGLVLLRVAARALHIPFIASGGIADGRGMGAALMLGAQGINMGTRFVCSTEAPVHADIKAAIVAASERDTLLIFRTLHNTARVLRNRTSEEVVRLESIPGTQFSDLRHLVAGARGREALRSGHKDDGLVWASMACGLIHDVLPCRELIRRIVIEAEQCIAAGHQCFKVAPSASLHEHQQGVDSDHGDVPTREPVS